MPKDAQDVRYCFAFPYVGKNLHSFLKRHDKNPHLKVESLCKSKKGRDIELLKLGRLDGKATQRVALTCRHHACEMTASFVLEGIIDEVLADAAPGRWLREHVEVFIVPMVDKDGVEDRAGPAARRPVPTLPRQCTATPPRHGIMDRARREGIVEKEKPDDRISG